MLASPKKKPGRPPKAPASDMQPNVIRIGPPTPSSPIPPQANDWDSVPFLRQRLTALAAELAQAQKAATAAERRALALEQELNQERGIAVEERLRANEMADDLGEARNSVVLTDLGHALVNAKEAAISIACESVAHVRPHAAGDLWRRWVEQWPWLVATAENNTNGGGVAGPAAGTRTEEVTGDSYGPGGGEEGRADTSGGAGE